MRVTPGEFNVSSTDPVIVLKNRIVPFEHEATTTDASRLAKLTDCKSGLSNLTHSTRSLKLTFDLPDLVVSQIGSAGMCQIFVRQSLSHVAINCLACASHLQPWRYSKHKKGFLTCCQNNQMIEQRHPTPWMLEELFHLYTTTMQPFHR